MYVVELYILAVLMCKAYPQTVDCKTCIIL